MEQKKIAIIGTAEGQKQLYIKAKQKGLYTIAFSYDRGCIPLDLIDEYYEISIIEKDIIVEICRDLRVDGVVSNGSELTANIASYIADRLSLETTPYDVIKRLQDKSQVRTLTENVDELQPVRSYVYNAISNEAKFLPCVVKPVTGGGKRGVSFADSPQSFRNAVLYALESSDTQPLIEEYVLGREVSVESISFHGIHYVIQITDKDSSGAPHFVELGHHQPSNLPYNVQSKIRRVVPRILDAVGYKSGASHIELKITDDGKIYLIEINPRGGGDEISNSLVFLSTGFDYIGAIIDVAIGNFSFPIIGESKCAGILFLTKQTENLLPLFLTAKHQPWYVTGNIDSYDLKECLGNASKNGFLIYQSDKRIINLNSMSRNKRVIVLGATGSLGTHIAVHMKKCGYDVIAVGHSRPDNGFYAELGIEYMTLDIADKSAFDRLPQENVWAVLNFAGALPAVMQGFNGDLYISSVVQGTMNILEYCRKIKVDRIIFPQSLFDVCHLFGSKNPIPGEPTHLTPYVGDHAVYVICKNAACDLIEHYYQTYGLKRFIFRLSRIYLYHPNPYTYRDGKKVMVSDRYLIYKAMKGEQLEIWGDPDLILETICIKDFLQIIEKAVEVNHDGGFYNVGSGGSTLRERIEAIADVFSPEGKRCPIVYCPEKPSARQFVLDYSKTEQELGYHPQYNFKAYLEDFKKEMAEQPFQKIWGLESEYYKPE